MVYIQLIVKRKMVVMAEDLGHNYARTVGAPPDDDDDDDDECENFRGVDVVWLELCEEWPLDQPLMMMMMLMMQCSML